MFPTQGLNPGLLHCRWILYQLRQGKPKDTGVGSLSLLQGIIPTQGSKQGLLRCRQIVCQLSQQGSPLAHCGHSLLPSQAIGLVLFSYFLLLSGEATPTPHPSAGPVWLQLLKGEHPRHLAATPLRVLPVWPRGPDCRYSCGLRAV